MSHVLTTRLILCALALCLSAAAPASAVEADFNPQVEVRKDTSHPREAYYVRGSIIIRAPRERIWALMTDCSATRRMVPQLRRCRVEAEGEGWDHRKHVLRSGPFRLTSIFRSDYDYLESVEISLVSGDMDVQEGVWRLTAIDGDLTRLEYEAWSKPGIWVPDWFIARCIKKDVPTILTNLRNMAEEQAS
ncbi:MAG: SRPBCC family protein [Pseudomonadota bacterium]